MADLVYLYAWIPAASATADLHDLPGMAGRPIETRPCGPAVAVVSRVPSEQYDAARIEERLTELWNYERYTMPEHRHGTYFYTHNDGLQDQSVLYKASGLNATP